MKKFLQNTIDYDNLNLEKQVLCNEATSLCSYIDELCSFMLYATPYNWEAPDKKEDHP